MRRLALVPVLAVSLLLVPSAEPALAICGTGTFEQTIQASDAVWWATVTTASPLPDYSSGFTRGWEFTVRLNRVLKGPGTAGGSATVHAGACNPTPLSWATDKAPSFVGRAMFFAGSMESDGTLSNLLPFNPRFPQQTLYERALKDLGLESTFPVWQVVVPAALVVLLAVGIFVVARRRRATSG